MTPFATPAAFFILTYLVIGLAFGLFFSSIIRRKPQLRSDTTTHYSQIPWYAWARLWLATEFFWPIVALAIAVPSVLKKR